jgi:hypothetical protein
MTNQIDYYNKYIKYKTKYINLKNQYINVNITQNNIQKGGAHIKMRIDDNINNKYPSLDKEVNISGYMHSKLNNNGCFY